MSRRLKLVLPWLFTLLIVGYLMWRVDLDQVLAAIGRADLGAFIGILLGATVVVFVADSGTLVVLFRRALGIETSYNEMLAVKGTSYFLNAINYSAGSGAIAFFLTRKKDVPFLRGLSALILLNFVDVIALLILMSLGFIFGRGFLPIEVVDQLPLVLGIGWAVVAGALSYWNMGFDWFVLGRMRSWRIFEAFGQMSAADYAQLVSVRLAFVSLYVVMNWLLLPTFGVPIDLMAMLVYTPILTFVQIIPLSLSGLGAIQVVMVLLYSRHVPAGAGEAEAVIVAFSTVLGPAITVARLLIGYAFIANVARDFVPKAEELAQAKADAASEGEAERAGCPRRK